MRAPAPRAEANPPTAPSPNIMVGSCSATPASILTPICAAPTGAVSSKGVGMVASLSTPNSVLLVLNSVLRALDGILAIVLPA